MDEHTSYVDDVFRLAQAQFVHILVVTTGPRTGSWIEITDSPKLLGRSAGAAIDLADSGISGRHCLVSLEAHEVVVSDLGSRNGTWVEGERVEDHRVLSVGSRIQIGSTLLRHELRSREELDRELRQRDELARAATYVRSLLPQRIRLGKVRTDWSYVPSAQLGGDAFGYHFLSESCFAVYFLDVCGHGPSAALHSVAVLNVLRRQGIPLVDFTRPNDVLAALNQAFPMEQHGGMYFTLWYGIYRPQARTLTWSSAGHPPALLCSASGGRGRPLAVQSYPVGMMEEVTWKAVEVRPPPGSRLFLYSDGAYDFKTKEGPRFSHPEFLDLLDSAQQAGHIEVAGLERELRKRLASPSFEDDFSLLVLDFD